MLKRTWKYFQELKYEGQEIMIVGSKEDVAVNVGECCELLLDKHLARFDGFVGKLKEELSIARDREEAETRRKEDLIEEERFRRRMEEEVKMEEMKMEMKKKGFEFSRDEIVKSDEKSETPQTENNKVCLRLVSVLESV